METIRPTGLFELPRKAYHLVRLVLNGYTYERHSHSGFHEFLFVTGGSLRHRINDTAFTQEAGEIVFVRSGDEHELRSNDCTMSNLAFPAFWFDELNTLWGTKEWTARLLGEEVPRTRIPATRMDELDRRLDQLLNRNNSWEGRMLFARFLMDLIAEHFLPQPDEAADLPDWLQALTQWVKNQTAVPDHHAVIRQSCRCREHVARSFRKCLGMSLSQFLNEERIARAAAMLAHTNRPIYDIATAVGFENPSYFHRLFKKQHDVSPQEYRRLNSRYLLVHGEY